MLAFWFPQQSPLMPPTMNPPAEEMPADPETDKELGGQLTADSPSKKSSSASPPERDVKAQSLPGSFDGQNAKAKGGRKHRVSRSKHASKTWTTHALPEDKRKQFALFLKTGGDPDWPTKALIVYFCRHLDSLEDKKLHARELERCREINRRRFMECQSPFGEGQSDADSEGSGASY